MLAKDSALPQDSPLVGLALQVARTPAANLDVGAMLAGVCTALPVAVGVAGAVVVMVTAPDPLCGAVFGSDAAAVRLGELQRRADAGPLAEAVRTGRVSATPDLTRIAPADLAAAAAETGLASAVTIPFALDGRPAGALQLFGTGYRPVPAGLAERVRPLLEVVVTRLSDERAFGRVSAAAARATALLEAGMPIAHAVGVLAERYHTDVEEAARFLAGQAAGSGRSEEATAAAIVAATGRRSTPVDDAPGHVPGPRPGTSDPMPGTDTGHTTDPLSWLAGDLPMPRASRPRPGAHRDDGPGRGPEPERRPRHRRADIS